MSKKCILGKCALCSRENIELMKSHIIPKLVYTRVKAYENSRFRNYFDFNQIYQDGEKKPMLCHDCEEFFSKYELEFTNKFLKKYLALNNQTLPSQYDGIQNYIITVAWRILYDDLFAYNSFDNTYMQNTYELFEKRLRKYLNQIRTDNVEINALDKTCENQTQSFGEMIATCEKAKYDLTPETLENIEIYIFTLKELGYSDEIIKLFDASILGYCYNTGDQKKYIIFSLYKGLIIATIFWSNRVSFVPSSIKEFFNSLQSKNALKSSLKKELDYMLEQMKKASFKNQEILNSNNTIEKLKKRYENAKRLR
ncbi:hypothetical protein [Clostridium botulinum]|uniref:Uncharacterized protein n=1 Tax=Clostridium botulinum TaxID=1491 RepID=A0A6M0V7L2_CLOBO|nr:hypothetical protein [Clostridium botulinum]MCS6112549.1 hypothetical protein [Clostridium botulinum]NFF88712.1 hypothetical protein [Clostridium botulinum]NFG11214.1 hypothetical protein [Clostridium botulinum]NFL43406.1 hypothetical protein [Clostridium botulinum]NFN16119.1 hypothetical protein [Clostridium botulinum]